MTCVLHPQEAESVLRDALIALADMKSAGAPIEDREARLVSAEAELQGILHAQLQGSLEGSIQGQVGS